MKFDKDQCLVEEARRNKIKGKWIVKGLWVQLRGFKVKGHGAVKFKIKSRSRVRKLMIFFRINCECRENLERLRPRVRLRD